MGCLEFKDGTEQRSSVNQHFTQQKSTQNKQTNRYKEEGLKDGNLKKPKDDYKEAETKRKNSETSKSPSQKDNNNKFEKQLEDKTYLVLVEKSGVGKEALIEQMILKEVQTKCSINSKKDEPKIKEGILGDEYVIVDTPSFSFDEIDKREQIIKEFQEYFEVPKYISSIGIIVNFERTDLMKKKVQSILKYLRKFKNIISIIVVDMELSENEEEDKNHLRDSFEHMGLNQIIFINKNMNQEEIQEQFKQINFIKTKIDFTETIFEKPDKTEEDAILKMLNEHIRQP